MADTLPFVPLLIPVPVVGIQEDFGCAELVLVIVALELVAFGHIPTSEELAAAFPLNPVVPTPVPNTFVVEVFKGALRYVGMVTVTVLTETEGAQVRPIPIPRLTDSLEPA